MPSSAFYFSAFPRVKYEHGQRELTSALDSAVRKFERQKIHFVRRIMIYTSAYFSVLVFAFESVYNAFCVGVGVGVCICVCVCVCVFLASADQSSYLECSLTLTLTLTLTHPFSKWKQNSREVNICSICVGSSSWYRNKLKNLVLSETHFALYKPSPLTYGPFLVFIN